LGHLEGLWQLSIVDGMQPITIADSKIEMFAAALGKI
jgi:hypothetical protein